MFVRIPSSAAGTEGVAARILIPRQPRFTNGAPVVVNVPGGVQATFAFQAAKDPTLQKTMTAVLVNDVATY